MGLFIKQTEQRTQLQSKIAADLAERLNKRPLESGAAKPPVQPAILDNQHTMRPLAWVWILLGVLATAGVIYVLSR